MKHAISEQDRIFKGRVESAAFPVQEFDHRAHVRLAYIYLSPSKDTASAVVLMKAALLGLLKNAGIDPAAKYHQTLTEAWILAVHHFLSRTESAQSADDFIEQHRQLLDSKIMLSHYSAEVLFSDAARNAFVEPNLEPIPRYSKHSA